ncbi:SRPBCC family protein [uncultured Roseobacter sp.]|uniref:SRPBCC family protein n=1 Tax=uncultured Roseobacter sp. TaxID=114847 RepID=UPI0026287C6F|nr:SRPBCC family protein [uncultured Roseobacter sp.]
MTFATPALWIAGGLIALSAATLALPRHVSVERSAVLQATPEAVLALAASNGGYQTFNPYKTRDPELKIELFGPEAGVGSGFHFDGKEGKGQQTVAGVTDDTVRYAIDLGAMGQPKQAIHAVPSETGTQVTWRIESDMGVNPAFRVFGLFMERMMGPTLELGLENLRKAAA